jgi:hypothetical protein
MKTQYLQDEGVDRSSDSRKAFVWDFEDSQSSQWSSLDPSQSNVEEANLSPSLAHTNALGRVSLIQHINGWTRKH